MFIKREVTAFMGLMRIAKKVILYTAAILVFRVDI